MKKAVQPTPKLKLNKFQPTFEQLKKVLRRCGAYYHSADLFYQELWKQRLANIGFYVLSVERLPYHPVWAIRLRALRGLTEDEPAVADSLR